MPAARHRRIPVIPPSFFRPAPCLLPPACCLLRYPEGVDPYRLTVADVAAALATDVTRGLADADARTRLARDGPDELTAHPPVPGWRRFLAQFGDVLVILLLVATAVSAILWIVERETALPSHPLDRRA